MSGNREAKNVYFIWNFQFNPTNETMVKIKMNASHTGYRCQEHRTRISQRGGIHLLTHTHH